MASLMWPECLLPDFILCKNNPLLILLCRENFTPKINIAAPKRVLFVGLSLSQDIAVRLLADQTDIEIIGMVNNWAEAKTAIAEKRPDIIIMDHQNHELIEAELNPLLENSERDLKVIYLSSADNRIIIHDRKQINDAVMPDLLRAIITGSPDEASE